MITPRTRRAMATGLACVMALSMKTGCAVRVVPLADARDDAALSATDAAVDPMAPDDRPAATVDALSKTARRPRPTCPPRTCRPQPAAAASTCSWWSTTPTPCAPGRISSTPTSAPSCSTSSRARACVTCMSAS